MKKKKIAVLVTAILVTGILAAAVPAWRPYRIRHYNALAYNSLKDVCTAQETYFFYHKNYASLENLQLPDVGGHPVVIEVLWNSEKGYMMGAYHLRGNDVYIKFGPDRPILSCSEIQKLKRDLDSRSYDGLAAWCGAAREKIALYR